ncbi:hypothetical protein [Candidatus Poriferisodalis sp.]|uniref:hypothetical protein n=1 Tax=Candidatus Poriferisodalis sp. TaxID=3101277 RepID=UPI003B02B1BB
MKFTAQRKKFLTAAATLAVAGSIVAGVAAVTATGTARLEIPDPRTHEPQAASESTYTTAGVLEEPIPAPQLPVIRRRYREPGITANSVGEHPNLPLSPIQTATAVIEPAHEQPFLPNDGEQAECRTFHSLIVDGKSWNADVVLAMAWRESRCNARLVSITNDWGLLQLNATCWAGKAIDGLPDVHSLPASVAPVDLRCDGRTQSTTTAQWCYRAKEARYDTGSLPASPCDAWLDPAINVETAYALWERYGWRPWCFSDEMRATYACQAAEKSL